MNTTGDAEPTDIVHGGAEGVGRRWYRRPRTLAVVAVTSIACVVAASFPYLLAYAPLYNSSGFVCWGGSNTEQRCVLRYEQLPGPAWGFTLGNSGRLGVTVVSIEAKQPGGLTASEVRTWSANDMSDFNPPAVSTPFEPFSLGAGSERLIGFSLPALTCDLARTAADGSLVESVTITYRVAGITRESRVQLWQAVDIGRPGRCVT
jgi:hypothetical protein